jgi:hypothetical protein
MVGNGGTAMTQAVNAQPEALQQADQLWARLKPLVAAALQHNSAINQGVKFDDIEARSVSVGDLLARLLMETSLTAQAAGQAGQAEQTAREAVREKAAAQPVPADPASLQITRMKARPAVVKTARGEVRYRRDYLYFPELHSGVFPPRSGLGCA